MRQNLRPALLRWYRRHRRDLPWRRSNDPYAIWVSEVMLQQTRVATVLPYYRRLLDRFPDVRSLARAEEEEVLALWSGLGYYRRARAMLAAAREIVERHGGRLPADAKLLRELPGIGSYTAGAIASIAFDLAEPVLDGNVRRVLSRIFAVDGSSPAAETRELRARAGELVNGPQPGDLNQALMELGAVVCTPRDPECDACPVSPHCAALAADRVGDYPAPRERPAVEAVRVGVAVVRRGPKVLLERPDEASPLRGSWDLPAVELRPNDKGEAVLVRTLTRRHRLEVRLVDGAARASHGIMQRKLQLEVHTGRLLRGRVAGRPGLRWVGEAELGDVAVSGATTKVLRLLQG